jgi:hypothetical protein
VGEAPKDTGYTEVVVGGGSACALRDSGTTACWGEQKKPPADSMVDIATTDTFACGIVATDGNLKCWSDFPNGVPFQVPAGVSVSRLSLGAAGYACVVGRNAGALQCWPGTVLPELAMPPAGVFVDVSAGAVDACAIAADGSAKCWGGNAYGQDGSVSAVYRQVVAGKDTICVVNQDSSAVCSGNGPVVQNKPPFVKFIEISVGEDVACGIEPDGTVACWGNMVGGVPQPANLKALVE